MVSVEVRMPALRAFLVGTAKNEGPFLLEWVAHHLEVGFTDIVLYQNDSDDLTHEMASILRDLGVIQYYINRAPRGGHQVRAYTRAANLPEYAAADYAMALDLDEFLIIKVGDHRLPDLIAAAPPFDQMQVNWRLFGSSGKRQQSFRLQMERFVMADYLMADNAHFNAFKALFRPARYSRPGVHQPKLREDAPTQVRVTNGSGLPRTPTRSATTTRPIRVGSVWHRSTITSSAIWIPLSSRRAVVPPIRTTARSA
ncbi:glycosyltransferase family 2 protein [Gemmobacter lanyuensis]